MMIETADQSITVCHRRLACRFIRHRVTGAGPMRSPVLVFLHEGLGSMDFWGDFPERLCAATGRDGFLYDRLGHGASDDATEPRDIDYLDIEADPFLTGVLDAAHIPSAFFIGHSDGGTIALLFAARQPDRTNGVITEAAHVFVDDVTIDGIRSAVRAWQHGRLRSALTPYHGKKTASVFHRWADTWLADWFSAWRIDHRLPAVTCPVLAMQGLDDPYGTVEQVDRILESTAGPSRKVMIPDCGHTPHRDQPEKALAAMTDFIAHGT